MRLMYVNFNLFELDVFLCKKGDACRAETPWRGMLAFRPKDCYIRFTAITTCITDEIGSWHDISEGFRSLKRDQDGLFWSQIRA